MTDVENLRLSIALVCLFAIYCYIVIIFRYSSKIIQRRVSLYVLYGVMPLLVTSILIAFLVVGNHLAITYLGSLFILFIIFFISFNADVRHIYWASLNFIFHLITVRGIITGCYAIITKANLVNIINTDESYLLSLTITMCIMVVFLYLFNKYTDIEKIKILISNKTQLRFVYHSETIIFTYTLISTYAYYYELNIIWFTIFHIITSSMTLLSFYIIFDFAIKTSIWRREELDNRLIQKNLNLQLIRSKEKKEMYEAVRKFNHDVKNLIYSAGILLNNKEYEELRGLLTTTEKVIHSNTERIRIFSNNDLIDSILYELSLRCQQENILFEASCWIPPNLGISNLDLSRIINNLTDNALEACRYVQDENKKIEISSKEKAGVYTLLIVNTFNKEKINFNKNKLYTTKKNKEFHGMGIINVNEIVSKYEGQTKIDINQELGIFSYYVIFIMNG